MQVAGMHAYCMHMHACIRMHALCMHMHACHACMHACMQERVVEIEHGSFTPLVTSSTGGLAPLASAFYKRLATHLAEKRAQPYAQVKGWLSTRLSFSLMRSAILCIRGTRTHRQVVLPLSELSIPLACAEAKIDI